MNIVEGAMTYRGFSTHYRIVTPDAPIVGKVSHDTPRHLCLLEDWLNAHE